MIVADNETAFDLLYYEAISKTVVRLISEASDQPLSIGIHGDWGTGKSSVPLMVEGAFEPDERTLCVTFNGWLFQGLEDAKAVLVETIVQNLLSSRSGTRKVRDQARKVPPCGKLVVPCLEADSNSPAGGGQRAFDGLRG